MTGRAVLSPDGVYRYVLERLFQPELDRNRGRVLFVMLNPSTADELQDDPTVRRCVGFAQTWGFTELGVVNLFGLRSTSPAALYDVNVDPVGADNDHWIKVEARRADLAVCAWGVHGRHLDRDRAVLALLADAGVRPHALGLTRDLQPRHPLYMRGDAEPLAYRGRPW